MLQCIESLNWYYQKIQISSVACINVNGTCSISDYIEVLSGDT